MFPGHLHEPFQGQHRLLEFLAESVVFLVPPGVSEADELAVKAREAGLEIGVESLQIRGESPEFTRVDDRL